MPISDQVVLEAARRLIHEGKHKLRHDEIAQEAGVSYRTVQRCIRRIVNDGQLIQRGTGKKGSFVYDLPNDRSRNIS